MTGPETVAEARDRMAATNRLCAEVCGLVNSELRSGQAWPVALIGVVLALESLLRTVPLATVSPEFRGMLVNLREAAMSLINSVGRSELDASYFPGGVQAEQERAAEWAPTQSEVETGLNMLRNDGIHIPSALVDVVRVTDRLLSMLTALAVKSDVLRETAPPEIMEIATLVPVLVLGLQLGLHIGENRSGQVTQKASPGAPVPPERVM